MNFGRRILPALICLTVSSCASSQWNEDTVVQKDPLTLEKIMFDPKDVHQTPVQIDREGETQWKFQCIPQLEYDVVAMRTKPDGTHVALLEMKKAKLHLSLPVKTWLPNNARKVLVEHENGHVKILQQVYDHAEEAARIASQAVINSVFQGEDRDDLKAKERAVDNATAVILSEYRRYTSHVVDRVSTRYDEFSDNCAYTIPSETLVKEAFFRSGVDLDKGRLGY